MALFIEIAPKKKKLHKFFLFPLGAFEFSPPAQIRRRGNQRAMSTFTWYTHHLQQCGSCVLVNQARVCRSVQGSTGAQTGLSGWETF